VKLLYTATETALGTW